VLLSCAAAAAGAEVDAGAGEGVLSSCCTTRADCKADLYSSGRTSSCVNFALLASVRGPRPGSGT
jgi:hypothetical protein